MPARGKEGAALMEAKAGHDERCKAVGWHHGSCAAGYGLLNDRAQWEGGRHIM